MYSCDPHATTIQREIYKKWFHLKIHIPDNNNFHIANIYLGLPHRYTNVARAVHNEMHAIYITLKAFINFNYKPIKTKAITEVNQNKFK